MSNCCKSCKCKSSRDDSRQCKDRKCTLCSKSSVPDFYDKSKPTVLSTTTVRNLQTSGDLVILDVQNSPANNPSAAYDAGHLEGALFVNWRTDLSNPDNLPLYELPSRKQFQSLCSRLGITKDSRIVAYDNFNNRLAIRTVFVFFYFDFRNIAIMEGGIVAWVNDSYPLTTLVPVVTPSQYIVRKENTSMIISADDVYNADVCNSTAVVDVRPSDQYLGLTKSSLIHTGQPISRYGHIGIPVGNSGKCNYSSTSFPWSDNFIGPENLYFKDLRTLCQMYQERGILGKKNIYVYCNEGVHASVGWFVLATMLDVQDVQVYEASFGEWAMLPGKPTVAIDPPIVV